MGMSQLLQNLRWAVRHLTHHPSYSATAILCLALGIGVNLAIFSLLHSLLLDPLPGIQDPSRLVTVTSPPISIPGLEGQTFTRPLSYANFLDYRKQNEVFSGFAAIYPTPVHLSDDQGAERLQGQFVTGDFFEILGLAPEAGRLIDGRDVGSSPGESVVVISHDLWQRRFGGDSGVIGRPVTLNRNRSRVLGVAPEDFQGVFLGDDADLWLPLTQVERLVPGFPAGGLSDPGNGWLLWFVGRLREGIGIEQAQARLDVLAARLDEGYGEDRRSVDLRLAPGIGIQPGMRSDALEPLWLLSGAVALVLLIACANVAGLILVRALGRSQELQVRSALGASGRHLFHQLLSESAVLAGVSAAIGLGLGLLLLRVLAGIRLGQYLPPLPENALEPRLVVLALVFAFVATLLSGTLPAVRVSRGLRPTLQRVVGDTHSGQRVRQGLIVLQVALAFLLLSGTGLFVRTLWNLQKIDPGFRGDNVLSLRLDLQTDGYGETEGRIFVERLLAGLKEVPAFVSTTVAAQAPLGHGGGHGSLTKVQVPRAGSQEHWLEFNRVGPDYFRTLGIPLIQGRGFTTGDRPGATSVVVVNESLARLLWPGEEKVVGRRVQVGGKSFEVIGVAQNIRQSTLVETTRPYLFEPLYQSFTPEIYVHVLSQGNPWQHVDAVRAVIRRLDDRIAVFETELLGQRVHHALAQPRLYVRLVGALGLLALTLTVIGIYGAIAYRGVERRSEIGIRVALGADRSRILLAEIGKALRLSGMGLGVGILAAIALGRVLEAQLYGVAPLDGPALTSAGVGILAMTVLASYLPARRAARTDPVRAIRS